MDLKNSYGFVLAKVVQDMVYSFNDSLKTYSLSTRDYGVLLTIYNNKNVSQKKIADILKIDKTTVVYIVDDLEEKNYLKRVKNPKDRRSFQLKLTKKGNSILKPLWDMRKEAERQTLKDLTEDQKIVINKICRDVNKV